MKTHTTRTCKQYLGDSVYADFDGRNIVLTTENGFDPSNTIVLEPSVLEALDNYRNWLPGKIREIEAGKGQPPWYWAYLHANGEIILKRWHGDHKDYTEDCEGNEFVQLVVPPFRASDQVEALQIARERLKP